MEDRVGKTYRFVIEIKDEKKGYKMPCRVGHAHKVKGAYDKSLRKKINDKIKQGEYDI